MQYVESDLDFVVLEKLIGSGYGYQALYKWLDILIPLVIFISCKFKLTKISRKMYEKNSGKKGDDSHVSLTSTSTSVRER